MTRNLPECIKCHRFLPLVSPDGVARRIKDALEQTDLYPMPPGDEPCTIDWVGRQGSVNTERLVLLRRYMDTLANQLQGICQLCAFREDNDMPPEEPITDAEIELMQDEAERAGDYYRKLVCLIALDAYATVPKGGPWRLPDGRNVTQDEAREECQRLKNKGIPPQRTIKRLQSRQRLKG